MCATIISTLETLPPFQRITLKIAEWNCKEASRLLHNAAHSRVIEVGIVDLTRFDHETERNFVEIDIMPTMKFATSDLPTDLGVLVESVRLAG